MTTNTGDGPLHDEMRALIPASLRGAFVAQYEKFIAKENAIELGVAGVIPVFRGSEVVDDTVEPEQPEHDDDQGDTGSADTEAAGNAELTAMDAEPTAMDVDELDMNPLDQPMITYAMASVWIYHSKIKTLRSLEFHKVNTK
jgi:hypothetical protein